VYLEPCSADEAAGLHACFRAHGHNGPHPVTIALLADWVDLFLCACTTGLATHSISASEFPSGMETPPSSAPSTASFCRFLTVAKVDPLSVSFWALSLRAQVPEEGTTAQGISWPGLEVEVDACRSVDRR
jgi:hypothetical protein